MLVHSSATLGEALSILADALHRKDNSRILTAAQDMEFLCDRGHVTKRSEPILRAISAFGFEACSESPRSKRSYLKLFDTTLPLAESLGSMEIAKMLTQCISFYGLRNLDGAQTLAELIFEELRKRKKYLNTGPEGPDYVISLGIVDLILHYIECLEREKELSSLAAKIESLMKASMTTDASSWLTILSRLLCYALSSLVERSILNLHLPSQTETELIKRRVTELWFPQAEAVGKGLLSGQNIVYSTGTATGKSLLAYIRAASSSIDEKVIYIVPTRTLAYEAYKTMSALVHSSQTPVAISTREKVDFDDKLSEYSVIISTYEKLNSLLKQKKIDETTIECLVADEIHFISNKDRGIPLEFTLTEMKRKTEAGDPQVIALSAMASKEDAEQMASWLGASLVQTEWKPVDLNEIIFYQGFLYHKNGLKEEVRSRIPPPSPSETHWRQRIAIAVGLVRDVLVREGQCMVIVRSRRDAEKAAEEISKYLSASRFFDIDSRKALTLKETQKKEFQREIQRSEPDLPLCATKTLRLIEDGVAYHHAGLPAKYREKVEHGVQEQIVKVLVTTTTFEVGVNLPVSTVIFLEMGRGRNAMPVRTYRNLAGRAGRPEFDVKGESIIIALTEDEFKNVRDRYFLSGLEPLGSGMRYFMRRQPAARYAIQSKILEVVSDLDTVDFQSLMNFMKQSWFWTRADEATRDEFAKHIRTELWKLRIFGFVEPIPSSNAIRITSSGKVAGKTMLSPISIRNLIDNTKRIFSGNYNKEALTMLILSLVGIPYEVGDNDEIIGRIKIPPEFGFISQVLDQDRELQEPRERIELCPRYATVLWFWVNSLPTEKVLELCGLDPSADAALLEELLPNDAYWVLNTLASIPDSALRMTNEQRALVKRLALDCKYGSSDPVSHELLNLGLEHIGRNTAIELSQYLREKNKDIKQLTESDLVALFPQNQESARFLYEDLQAKLENHSAERHL